MTLIHKAVLACSLSWAGAAFASASPDLEPGPIAGLSQDSVEVSSILLSKQFSTCLHTLHNKYRWTYTWEQVTRQRLDSQDTEYRFFGSRPHPFGPAHGKIEMVVVASKQDSGGVSYACNFITPR